MAKRSCSGIAGLGVCMGSIDSVWDWRQLSNENGEDYFSDKNMSNEVGGDGN